MHKNQKKKNNLIKNIINYINSDVKLKATFNHPNRKYNLKLLLKYVIQLLTTGLSYRNVINYSNNKIHWWGSYSICKANRIMKPIDYKNPKGFL